MKAFPRLGMYVLIAEVTVLKQRCNGQQCGIQTIELSVTAISNLYVILHLGCLFLVTYFHY